MNDVSKEIDKALQRFSNDIKEVFKNYHTEEVKEEVVDDVFPKDCEEYWFVNDELDTDWTRWHNDCYDKVALSINNVFKTEEEAEQHKRFLLADAKLRKMADGGVFYIVYYKEDKRFAPYNNKCNIINHCGFSMREKAVEAIKEIGDDDLKLIFNIKE